MDVGLLSSEFVNLLKTFRSALNKEIENLEHSTQDMDMLEKTVYEISSLLTSEGLPTFIGELKDILKTVTENENNSVINENNNATISETKKLTSETLETIKVEKVNDQMDVEISEIEEEKTVDIKKSDLVRYKQEWPLRYAKLLCKVLEPILPFLILRRNSGLLFYLDDLIPCYDTNILADSLYVYTCRDPVTKEIIFKCYEDHKKTEEADVHIHTHIARRIYERIMNFITLYNELQQEPHIPMTTWKRFLIRVNSAGESLVEILVSWPDEEISVLINKLKEEFSSEEAKDCNLHSFLISSKKKGKRHVVFGMPYIIEKVWNMSFVIDHSAKAMWNPVAMRNLSEVLYNLAKPIKNLTGIMFFDNLNSAIPLLCLADTCRNVVLRCSDGQKEFFTSEAVRNNILNFSCFAHHFEVKEVMSKYFSECSEVCFIIYDIIHFNENFVNKVANCEKISKVIILSAFDNILSLRKLARFFEFEHTEYPFIMTEVVPVDLCPFKDIVQMVCLLERTSLTLGKVTPNKNFSVECFKNIKNLKKGSEFVYHKLMKEWSERKGMSEVILKRLLDLQLILGLSNPNPLKKANLDDIDEFSFTSPLKETRCEATDEISTTPPLQEAQQHVTDEISNTSPSKNSNMISVEKEKISVVAKKETIQSWKEDEAKYKQEWPLRYAKLLCKVLEPMLPFLTIKRNSDLLFYLGDLILCNDTNMLADVLYVIRCWDSETKKFFFKCYEDYRWTEEADVHNHTDIARRIYERMMNFITLSLLQKPHIPMATWNRFLIRVNNAGESLVEIQVVWPEEEISVLINKLKEEFSSEEAKDCNLRSFLISFNDKPKIHVVFGMPYIIEKVWNMSFVIDHPVVAMWNPVAMRNLSEVLCKLAKPNKNQTGIMFFDSIYSAVPVLYMADTCRNAVLLCREDDKQKFFTSEAVRNNILNFSCSACYFELNEVMSKYFSECSEVCLVIYDIEKFREKVVKKVAHCEKISKVIYFLAYENIYSFIRLARFLEFEHTEYPFIITEVVPVDLCPFKDPVQMLCLLERTSLTLGKVTPNKNFSVECFNNIKNRNRGFVFAYRKLMKERQMKKWSEGKRMSEVILKSLLELQFIHGISNPNPLKKVHLKDTDEYSHTSPLKKMRYQVIDDDISNTLPLKEAQQHVTDEISNTLPLKNSNMTSVEKGKISAVANKKTIQSLIEDEESKDMVVNKAFLDDLNESQKMIMTQIIEDLNDATKLNADDKYNTAVKYKKERANLEAERLSDILLPFLPTLVKGAVRGLVFKQLDMNVCPSEGKLCEKYRIILERNSLTGKILNTLNSDNAMIPLPHSFSYKAKNICKLVAAFILKSNYPMFNEKGQGFWSMIIRVNSKSDPWLLIEGNVETVEEAKIILSDLEPKLKSFVKTSIVERSVPDLKNIFLKIFTKTNAEARVVLGDYMLNETAGVFHIKFHGERYPYYSPDGMMGLANEVLKLASLGKKWGVVQVGCVCGIESLLLAKKCAKFYLLRQPDKQDIHFLLEENGIKNFVYNPVNTAQEMVSVIVKDMAQYPNVCVLYDLSDPVGFFGASVLRNNFHVKRIIYMIDPKNNKWIKEVVACCQNRTDQKEAFFVTKFASVDMAPCEDDVKIMCVLERKLSVKSSLNYYFSVNKVKELLRR